VRVRAEEVIREINDGEKVSREALAELAKTVARATWVARIATKRFIKTDVGGKEEWRRVAAAVSNSTEHLLERFKAGVHAISIDEVLEHEESSLAFYDAERMEIAEVRKYVSPLLWTEHQKDMTREAKEAKQLLEAVEKEIKTLRALAVDEPTAPEREIVSKVVHFEDRLYFAGEELDPKKIEAEITAYQEQIALPVEE
jgi:hypothetical protein